jgi:hypothetical protein
MLRFVFVIVALLAGPLRAQPEPGPSPPPPPLTGRLEGRVYISPTGTFRIAVPVLPELGGTVIDTANVVTFQDGFNVHVSIGVFPQDATQRWELSTRGTQDYLVYFFSNYVMSDFQQMFPGASIESAQYSPVLLNGALFTYTLLPGGSMFDDKHAIVGPSESPPVAKRGNLVFVRNDYIYVISTELAERVIERRTYKKPTAEEDEILRKRLADIVMKMEFTRPPAGS